MYIVYGFCEKCSLMVYCSTILDNHIKDYINNDNYLVVYC